MAVMYTAPTLWASIPSPSSATCKISCSVANIVEWSEPQFSDVDLGELSLKNKDADSQAILTLYTNGDVTIIADNGNAAELSFDHYSLQTKYKLEYDGSGLKQTGGKPTGWTSFDKFIANGTQIIHMPTDGAVEITLSVKTKAEKISDKNSGSYTATQTLTVCWKS